MTRPFLLQEAIFSKKESNQPTAESRPQRGPGPHRLWR